MRLALIDGMAVLHRAYHAYPKLNSPEGEVVNAVYGFSAILLNVIKSLRPSHIAVAMDVKGKTFRHKLYEEYKGTRKKTDVELIEQIPKTYELIKTFNIPLLAKPGYEADDVLATIVEQVELGADDEIYIVTGDMDILQLVKDGVFVYAAKIGQNNNVIIDKEGVVRKFGVGPELVVDYKALVGDVSDNIKGVTGVGPKTTIKLLKEYGGLDEIYNHLDEMDSKLRDRLERGRKSAYLSQELARIVRDVPVEFKLTDCELADYDREKVIELFERYGFKSLINKLNGSREMEPKKVINTEQISLW